MHFFHFLKASNKSSVLLRELLRFYRIKNSQPAKALDDLKATQVNS